MNLSRRSIRGGDRGVPLGESRCGTLPRPFRTRASALSILPADEMTGHGIIADANAALNAVSRAVRTSEAPTGARATARAGFFGGAGGPAKPGTPSRRLTDQCRSEMRSPRQFPRVHSVVPRGKKGAPVGVLPMPIQAVLTQAAAPFHFRAESGSVSCAVSSAAMGRDPYLFVAPAAPKRLAVRR